MQEANSERVIAETAREIDAEYEQVLAIPEGERAARRPPVHAHSAPIAALESCGLFQGPRQETIVSIENSEKVSMTIKRLQMMNHRTRLKIGVIFVTEGQTTQNEILSVTFDQTSPHFREFITGLGWPVLLESHVGYDGGLDCKNEKSGTTSIYYADFTHEVMFHIAPLIPTDPSDPQQIYKKRHIGNDHVAIQSGSHYDLPARVGAVQGRDQMEKRARVVRTPQVARRREEEGTARTRTRNRNRRNGDVLSDTVAVYRFAD
jgi:hypothetical protein